MFVKNAWYCAGWQSDLSSAKDALVSRRIAGESVLIYRKLNGDVVALDDRCCHRQAPLSLGRKEGDDIRCMYHGWKFNPEGKCIEIPGQAEVRQNACVPSYPAVVKNDWIWIWMGDPEKAEESLICESIGPSHPDWDMNPRHIRVNTNYRQEIANLTDLTHVAWVHMDTFGGTTKYPEIKGKLSMLDRGIHNDMWVHSVPAPSFAKHLFPDDALFDLHFDVTVTIPCNFILHFRVFTAGTNTAGPSNGELILDTFSSQAVTPRDADSVDYYYSWSTRKGTAHPGLIQLLIEANEDAFLEDKMFLEGQYQRMKDKPDYKMVDYAHDAGPGRMFWLLDKLLKDEAEAAA